MTRVTKREWGRKPIVDTALLVALAGMVFVYPFESHFRFSLGVVVLGVLLLYFDDLPPLGTATLSGALIFMIRSTMNYIGGAESFGASVMLNLPAFFYYLSFGLLFSVLQLRRYTKNIVALILLLSMIDVLSNCVELTLRGEWAAHRLEVVFVNLMAVGIMRSSLAAYGYYLLKQYRSIVLAEEQMDRYGQLTMMIAQLKAELFYLRKSSQDIEEVMEESYSLYKEMHSRDLALDEVADQTCSKQALSIARKIHEVKKDYYRVAAGIESILEPSAIEQGMRLSEIFSIIDQNTKRTLEELNKQIAVIFEYQDDLLTNKHYTIVSMLNNLVINAIEACGDKGKIQVRQTSDKSTVTFTVEDDGPGIKPEDYEMIFHVGYSTKFCSHTGKMSTGLGLSHVRDLTELLGGTIEVDSCPEVATRFVIKIPKSGLV